VRHATSYPADERLVSGLAVTLDRGRRTGRGLTLVRREWNPYTSTFPTEVVTCRLADGEMIQVLCKYDVEHEHDSHGHRGGLSYEARVYRDVLEPIGFSTPTFYGMYRDPADGLAWLVLEYVDESLQLRKAPSPSAIVNAARWIGRFHAAFGEAARGTNDLDLRAYDPGYFRGWPQRANEFAGKLHERFPWFRRCCERFEHSTRLLLGGSKTVIHGEFYPANILVRADVIRPIDWQSTAIGPGEIDLAALTDGHWPVETVRACERAYVTSRWPCGAPDGFVTRLELARAYLHLRWLGDRPSRTTDASSLWRFDRLRSLHECLQGT
jgi:hypothetical protein